MVSGHFISKCLLWSVVRGQFCPEIDHGLTTGCIDCTRVLCILVHVLDISVPVILTYKNFNILTVRDEIIIVLAIPH